MKVKGILSLIVAIGVLTNPLQAFASESVEQNPIIQGGDGVLTPGEAGGIEVGNSQTTMRIYGEEKFAYPTGHGFAAERGNNLYDQMHGLNAKVVGDNNVKNGPDRIVVEGTEHTLIQTKYYKTASGTIGACFDENGIFRYVDKNNKPMKIEVPSNQYESSINLMKTKIQEGKVPGVTDPEMAYDIVKKGSLSYEQAVNLAKPMNIESLKYDAKTGAVSAASAFGISAVITYAVNRHYGVERKDAVKYAAVSGIQTGGIVFATSVVAAQLAKGGLNQALTPISYAIVDSLGERGIQILASTAPGATGSARTVAAGVVRNNLITGTVTVVVLSIPQVVDLFRGRISGAQLTKNVATITGGVAGGVAGSLGGAALGSAIAPGAGTIVGGIIGGIVGGTGAGLGTNAIIDHFTESDGEKMAKILEEEFAVLAEEYLLTQDEADDISKSVSAALDGNTVKDMYASSNRNKFARELMTPIIEERIAKRAHIDLPTEDEMAYEMEELLTDVAFVH
jgi:hypothetical protein